ncbi:MAG TPA: hypothetical protein VHE61_21280 [Opitutaceae bacterium]|nr:hypothetical protein [Opitutaceae bacterium]
MTPEILQQLRDRATDVRARWEALLRIEPTSGPLANPDTLALLIPQTLAQLLHSLVHRPAIRMTLAAAHAIRPPGCGCGYNPFVAYYVAAEQALVETVILIQAGLPAAVRIESDVAEMVSAVRRTACAEIKTFCGICRHKGLVSDCLYPSQGT